jgi:hypothetical protein
MRGWALPGMQPQASGPRHPGLLGGCSHPHSAIHLQRTPPKRAETLKLFRSGCIPVALISHFMPILAISSSLFNRPLEQPGGSRHPPSFTILLCFCCQLCSLLALTELAPSCAYTAGNDHAALKPRFALELVTAIEYCLKLSRASELRAAWSAGCRRGHWQRRRR